MIKMVKVGQIIISNNEKYKVSDIWPEGASKCIDFIAKRTEQTGIDKNGEPVYAGRGFSYAVKNWELEKKPMELQTVDLSGESTYKEILLSYGFLPETIEGWTEEQCQAECDDINREKNDVHQY